MEVVTVAAVAPVVVTVVREDYGRENVTEEISYEDAVCFSAAASFEFTLGSGNELVMFQRYSTALE